MSQRYQSRSISQAYCGMKEVVEKTLSMTPINIV